MYWDLLTKTDTYGWNISKKSFFFREYQSKVDNENISIYNGSPIIWKSNVGL